MKRLKLITIVFLLLGCGSVYAQTSAITQFCWRGGVPAVTSGLNSTNYLQGTIPSCTVTVYLTGTLTKATIYADGSNTPLANPFTANTLGSAAPGQWLFYASTSNQYDVVLSGGIPPNTYPAPVTLVGLGSGGGGGGGNPCTDLAQSLQYNNGGAFGCTPLAYDPTSGDFYVPNSGSFFAWAAGEDGFEFCTDPNAPIGSNRCPPSGTGAIGLYAGADLTLSSESLINLRSINNDIDINAEGGTTRIEAQNTIWLDSTLQFGVGTVPITTTPYDVGANCLVTCLFDATSGAITANLPVATSDFSEGLTYYFIKADSSGNTVTIVPNGSETINGAANYVLSSQFQSVTLQAIEDPAGSFTGGWYVIASGPAGGGGGGLSGQTAGYAVEAATPTTATGPFPMDDSITTANTITAHKAFAVNDGSGLGGGINGTEGTASSGASGIDKFWADSATHRWKFNPNNAGAFFVPGVATAGTSGHCPQFAANGIDLTDSGGACGGGGGVSYSNYGGVNTYGDSITQGTGSANFMVQGLGATGYAQDLIADFGGNGQNFGYGGDQAADMSIKVYTNANPAAQNNFLTTMMISTNDVNVYGTDTNKQNIFLRALEASIGWAAIPDTQKFYVKNTNICTRTGTWATDSGAPRGGDIYSTTSGSSLSCSVTVPTGSAAIYFGYTACDGYSPGSSAITIDGTSPGSDATVLNYGQGGAAISTANGSTCSRFLSRYPVSVGAHTFLLTVNAGGGVVEPEWIGTPTLGVGLTAPPVAFVGGTPWNEANSPSTITAAYNTIITNAVSTMAGDGTPVYFVDIRNGVNTANSKTTTPLNSTTDYDGGQQGTILCPASPLNPYHPNSSIYWSRSCGHGHLAANFETAIGIKAGGPTPSLAVQGQTLAPNGFTVGYPYGSGLNGDMRIGAIAGSYYNYASDSALHFSNPSSTGCFTYENGNSPTGLTVPMATPFLTTCPSGYTQSLTGYNLATNNSTEITDTGYSADVFMFPNMQTRSTVSYSIGQAFTQGNYAKYTYIHFGATDARNAAWVGLGNNTGIFPGICVNTTIVGLGYTENQSGFSGAVPCPTSGDPIQLNGNTTVHGNLTDSALTSGDIPQASTGGLLINGPAANTLCLSNGTNCPNLGPSYYWTLQPALFANTTVLGAIYRVTSASTFTTMTMHSTTGTCTTVPTINLLDLGTSPTTVYGSATTVTGFSPGVIPLSAVGQITGTFTVASGHYIAIGFSSGTCATYPTLDATLN